MARLMAEDGAQLLSSRSSTVRELTSTIGLPEPIAAALVIGNCVR